MKASKIRPLFLAVSAATNPHMYGAAQGVPMQPTECQQQQAAHVGPASLTGTIVAVSAATPATFDSTGFAATTMTYTVIGNVKTFPKYGAKRAVTDWTPINGESAHIPGTPNFGGGEMVVADIPADPGVVLLAAAEVATVPRSFKLTMPDGEIHYLYALVSSFEYSGGSDAAVKEISCMLSFNKRPVVVAAT